MNNDKRNQLPWRITGGIIGLILLLSLISFLLPETIPEKLEKKIANVEVQTLETVRFDEMLELPARIQADRIGIVSSELPGKLAKWVVAEGETVSSGDVVAELDKSSLISKHEELKISKQRAVLAAEIAGRDITIATNSLRRAKAGLKSLKVQLTSAEARKELAQKEFKRIKALHDKDVVNDSRYDNAEDALTQATLSVENIKESVTQAEAGLDSAGIQLEQAKARLSMSRAQVRETEAAIKTLKIDISKCELRAPVNGRLDEHLADPGEYTSPGRPVCRIYDLDHVRAFVQVPDRYISFLDAEAKGIDRFIKQKMDHLQRNIHAEILLPGMPVYAENRKNTIPIPAEIVRIAEASDPQSNTFTVELRATNTGKVLKHGILATAKIRYLTYEQAIVVPMSCIQVTDRGPRVLVIEEKPAVEDNVIYNIPNTYEWIAVGTQQVLIPVIENKRSIARVRSIVPITIQKDSVLVSGELQAGDRLIISGWKGVMNGEEVNVVVRDGELL